MTRPARGVEVLSVKTHCGTLFETHNDALIKSAEGEENVPPYIGHIHQIVQTKNGNNVEHFCNVSWYYRPEECWGGRKVFHGAKELMRSAHKDWISEHTLMSVCHAHSLPDFQALKVITPADFFTRTEYKPNSREFRPDRVEVYCDCEMPYNPDQFMVECMLCKEWYHPACIGVTKESISKTPHWRCHDCIDHPMKAVKVKHTFVPNPCTVQVPSSILGKRTHTASCSVTSQQSHAQRGVHI